MFNNNLLLNKREFLKSTALLALPEISLDPEEADQFIQYIWDQSVWKDHARLVKMSKNEKNIRYIGFGDKNALVPAAGFTSQDYQKEFATEKITLSSKKMRGAVVIFDDDLEDGIEGNAFADSLMQLMATKISNQLDDAYYSSNTTSTGFSATDIRHELNGWRYDILNGTTGTVVGDCTVLSAASTSDFDIAGSIAETSTGSPYLTEYKFGKMLKSLDPKYKSIGRNNLRFFCPDAVLDDYGEALQNRGTNLGDDSIVKGAPLFFNRVPIVPVCQMSTKYKTGYAGTESMTGGTFSDCLLMPKNNLIIGIHRSLKLESKREPADECTYIFYSIRYDIAVEDPAAVVFLHDITTT